MAGNPTTADLKCASPNLATAAVRSAALGLFAALILAALPGLAKQWTPWPTFFAAYTSLCRTPTNIVHAVEALPTEGPRATAEIVSSEKLSHVPGKNVSLVRVKFPPGGLSPRHYHGGSVTVYVLSGTVRSQLEGEPARTFAAGDTFFEPLGAIHLFAQNVSNTESAEVLAVFIHDEGATLTTYF